MLKMSMTAINRIIYHSIAPSLRVLLLSVSIRSLLKGKHTCSAFILNLSYEHVNSVAETGVSIERWRC